MAQVLPLALLFLPVLSLAAAAQEPAPIPKPALALPWRSTEFRLGVFTSRFDTGLEVLSSAGAGALIDLEETLGMDSSTLAFRAEASFSLGARHRIHVDLFSLSRRGDRTLSEDVQIGNTVFPAGTGVDSEFDFQLYQLTYGYSLLQDDRVDLAVTFGIHGLGCAIDVDAEVLDLHESVDLLLPIPLPGFRFDVALTPDLFLRSRAEFIWIAVGDYSGLMSDISIRLEYAFSRTFCAGTGFNALDIQLKTDGDASGTDFEGSFEFSYSGLLFYAGILF